MVLIEEYSPRRMIHLQRNVKGVGKSFQEMVFIEGYRPRRMIHLQQNVTGVGGSFQKKKKKRSGLSLGWSFIGGFTVTIIPSTYESDFLTATSDRRSWLVG